MRSTQWDLARLGAVTARFGDAVVDPGCWPEIMEEISGAVGATGATLLQADVRLADMPRTASMHDAVASYFEQGWHARDLRAERGAPLLLGGHPVVIDQDIIVVEDIGREPYYQECLRPRGVQWCAVVGVWADSALWGLSIHRTAREGPFGEKDKQTLASLARRLTETATLSTKVGRRVLRGVSDALNLVGQPALSLDRMGFVVEANAAAEELFDREVRVHNRRLLIRDRNARAQLDTLTDCLRVTPDARALPADPIVVRREGRRPIVIRIHAIDGAARSPFVGARALLVLSDLERKSLAGTELMAKVFALSPAEARVTERVARGISPERAAEEIGISVITARNQLKSAFAKTDTHRQGELVALAARMGLL